MDAEKSPESGIVVGSIKKHPKFKDKKSKSRLIIAITVVFILLVGGALINNIRIQANKKSQEKRDYQTMMSEVKKYRSQGKDLTAEAVLLTYNKTHKTQTRGQQLSIALQLTAIYTTKKDFKSAIIWQQKIADLGGNTGFEQQYSLARTYLSASDKVNALKYFKLALVALDKDTRPIAKDSYRSSIEVQIKNLEKK